MVVWLTDIIVQLLSQGRILVQKCKTLVHPLLNHMEMCVYLQNIKIHSAKAFYQERANRVQTMSLCVHCEKRSSDLVP